MNAAKVTLTEEDKEGLGMAVGAGVIAVGGTDEQANDELLLFMAVPFVESIVAARIAEALRDAARRCVDNWEPVYTEGKGSEWPNDTTARWLHVLATEYDGGVS